MKFKFALFVMCLSAISTGCSSLSMNKTKAMVDQGAMQADAMSADNNSVQDETNTRTFTNYSPTRMAVLWKEKVLNMPSQPPVRGFSGRIYFYDSNDQPIRVQGELAVYGYDDSQEFKSEVADNKYVFPADRFEEHYAESELGPAYSIWIPWENKDGIRKSITLVPVFKTIDNHVIQGGTNRMALSGKAPPKIARTNIGSIPQAMAQSNLSSPNYNLTDREFETIKVPASLATRMSEAEARRFSPEANRQLDLAQSRQQNPNGQLYNQLSVQPQQQRQRSVAYGNGATAATNGRTTNFSDSAPVTINNMNPVNQAAGVRPIANYSQARVGVPVSRPKLEQPIAPGAPQPIRVFGKPGPIR